MERGERPKPGAQGVEGTDAATNGIAHSLLRSCVPFFGNGTVQIEFQGFACSFLSPPEDTRPT